MSLFLQYVWRSKLFRHYGAAVLLASFVADVAFHAVSPLLTAYSPTLSITSISAGETPDVPYDSDCGIPGHKGAGFHHHHYPALISSTGFTLPFTILKPDEPHRATPALYAPVVARLSRAPPLT